MHNINLAALFHMHWLEWRHTLPDGRVCIRLRTGRGDFDMVRVHVENNYGGEAQREKQAYEMRLAWQEGLFSYYEACFRRGDPRMSYYFSLEAEGAAYLYGQNNRLRSVRDAWDGGILPFHYHYAYPAEPKPDWARGCIGYQIFPDRFRREGDLEEGLEPWGSSRVANEYRFGGNLRGILAAVPYLKSLGVELIYMTPLFLSNTSHRYNTFNYYQIDPLLGTEEELHALVEALHANGMKILLDGVFNHCGTQFAPFVDALQNGEKSPSYDWFFFEGSSYRHFGTDLEMPKLNLRNGEAQQYFCRVGQHWIERFGMDGWRLDVSPEVWPDFWRKFRQAVHEKNPNALLVAECWDDSRQWLTLGDMFDSTMNYLFTDAVRAYFGDQCISLAEFDARINHAMAIYPHAVQEVLWNLMGSHDTMRIRTCCGEREWSHCAAFFFQMTHLGSPMIYYGDELGMSGGHDPECRHSMPWERVDGNAMLLLYKRLIALRRKSPALRTGAFRTCLLDEEAGVYAYLREADEQTACCVLCAKERRGEYLLALPQPFAGSRMLRDHVAQQVYAVIAGYIRIQLEPGQGMVFLA